MPEFRYRAKEGPEKVVQGVVEAPNEEKAIEKITSMGYVPVSIYSSEKEDGRPASPAALRSFKSRSFLLLFSRHLSRLLKSGVPIMRAMDLLASEEKDSRSRTVLKDIEKDIRRGKTLSQAMSAHPHFFSDTYVAIVRAGEAGGGLEESLSRMAFYLKKQEETSSKIRRALAYPIFLAISGIASVVFILTFIVPRLGRIYQDMGHELPWATRLIIQVSSFFHHYWFVLAGVGVLAYILISSFQRQVSAGYGDAFRLQIPLLGSLTLKTEFTRFLRTLELALNNGLSFLSALRVSIPAVQNKVLRDSLESCFEQVQKGGSFGQALKKIPYFSSMSANLVLIGEESGKLSETLSELAETHEREADETVAYLTTLLEPMMILFIGGIIGFIVMAMLLPIFEINAIF